MNWLVVAADPQRVSASTTASIATLGAQAWVNSAAYGSELVNSAEPTSDTTQTFSVSGLTRAQLLNGTFGVRVRASRGNSNTSFTASLDAVSVAVTYTASGSQAVTVTAVGVTTARGSDAFAYDQANRLTSATVAGLTETSTYDGDGVRFSRQAGGGPLSRYVTDPAAGLPVTLDDGTRTYVWGLGLAYAVTGSAIEVYHADRLGSVRALTDAAGSVIATYRADEFGIPVSSTGTSSQPFRYTGEPSDASGLTYLRARYYDPSIGRFLSRDPFGGFVSSPLSLNRYSYVANNPATRVDPSGNFPPLIAVVAGAALIGGVAGALGYVVSSVVTGQPLDPGQAFVAGVTGAAAGVGCLGGPWACAGASAAASAVQYGLAPGEKSAEGLILASSLGAGLGRLSYKPPFVPTANRFRPNPISLGALNPAWPRIADGLIRATGEFARSLSASLISGIAPSLVGGSAVAGSRVLGKAGVPVTASGRTGLGREMR